MTQTFSMKDDDNFYENCRGGRRRAEESPRALDRQRAVARRSSCTRVGNHANMRVRLPRFWPRVATRSIDRSCVGTDIV